MIKPFLRAELKWIWSVFQMNFLWKLWQGLVVLMLLILTSLIFLKFYYCTSPLLELLQTWSCRHQPGTAWGRVWRRIWISPSHSLPSGNTSQNLWKQSKSDAWIYGLKELHWSGQNWRDQCSTGLFQDNLLKIQHGKTMHPCTRLFRGWAGCAVAFSSPALAAVPVPSADSRGAGSPLFILWMHTLSLPAACQLLMLLLWLLCTHMYRKCIGKVY